MWTQSASAIAEMVTALAALLALWQLMSARNALRSTAYQGVVAHSLTLIENLLGNDELLDTFVRHSEQENAPANRPELRWHFMVLATMRHFENLYVQRRLGSIGKAEWRGYEALLENYVSRPGFREWWRAEPHATWFSRSFQAEIDRKIRERSGGAR